MNTIANNPNALAQLLGKEGKAHQDVGNLANAKQQADAKNVLDEYQDDFLPSAKGLQAAAALEKYQNAYSYSETMSLSLTTREGDQVTVDFRQLYAEYQQYKREQSYEEGPKGVRMFESREALEATAFEERFAFSVNGDLNEGELKAIFDVFEQVDKLSTDFFEGNIEQAFQKAMEMDVDMSQISNLSLNLTKTETRVTSYQQAAAYQGVQQQPVEGVKAEQEDGDDDASVADLPPYLQRMQDAIESLNERFENAREAFDEMMSGSLAQRYPEIADRPSWFDRVSSFHDKLAEAADLEKTTLKPSGVEIESAAQLAEKEAEALEDAKESEEVLTDKE